MCGMNYITNVNYLVPNNLCTVLKIWEGAGVDSQGGSIRYLYNLNGK